MSELGDGQEATRRQELIESAQDLVAAGLVDEAIRNYTEAGEIAIAASLLAKDGRLQEGAKLLLTHAFGQPKGLARGGPARSLAIRAAAYLQACNDGPRAQHIIKLMGGLDDAEAEAYRAVQRSVEGARPTARPDRPTPGRDTPLIPSAPAPRRPRKPRTPTTVSGLRKPSIPDLKIEMVSTPQESRPPGRPSGVLRIASRPPGPVPTEEKIDRSIQQLITSERPDAAAKVAFLAGRHEQALPLFLQVDDFVSAGACLRYLRRPEEAIVTLRRSRREGTSYREACREMAKAAGQLGYLDDGARAFCDRFLDTGPRSDQELSSFLDLAELLWSSGDEQRAERCLLGVMRLDPDNGQAQLMQLAWSTQRMRG